MHPACVIQDALGGGGFAGVNVCRETDVSGFGESLFKRHFGLSPDDCSSASSPPAPVPLPQ